MSIDLHKLPYNDCVEQEFKFWLREFRRKNNLTQEQLGVQIGAAHVTIGQWERGDNRPDPERLLKLAEFAREDPHRLFNMVYGLPLPEERGNLPKRIAAIIQQAEQMSDDELARVADYFELLIGSRVLRAKNAKGKNGAASGAIDRNDGG